MIKRTCVTQNSSDPTKVEYTVCCVCVAFSNAGGGDLRFFDETGTVLLDHEIERWDTNGISHVWVNVPALSNALSAIVARWGTTGAWPLASSGTWSANFRGVWHLGEEVVDESTGAAVHRDSSTNGFHADQNNNTGVRSIIGYGQEFDGIDDVIQHAYAPALNPDSFTLSCWARINTPAGIQGLLTSETSVGFEGYRLFIDGANLWKSALLGSPSMISEISSSPLTGPTQRWVHVATSYEAISGRHRIYLDGRLIGERVSTHVPLTTTHPFNIGSGFDFGNGEYFNGRIDEVRVVGEERSEDWLHAAWLNMASNALFNCYEVDTNRLVVAVENLPATNIVYGSAWLNGRLGGDVSAHEVTLFWGPTDGGTDPGAWSSSASLGIFNVFSTTLTYRVTGLSPDTTYYYTFQATSGTGTVWAGSSQSATTELFSVPVVTDGPGALPVPGGFNLHGELLAGDLAEVAIYWGDNDGGTDPAAWDHAIDFGRLMNGAFSSNISGLVSCGTYFYRVYASNDLGEAWTSPSTGFEAPSPPIGLRPESPLMIGDRFAIPSVTVTATNTMADVWLYYGPADGGTDPAAWAFAVQLGSVSDSVEPLDQSIAQLGECVTYAYRFRATNCSEDVWTSAESFTTLKFNRELDLTFCGYDQPKPLTNFPALVLFDTSIPGFDYADFTSPSGGDLRFFNADGTSLLNHEIENWTTSGTSRIWVQVPTLEDGSTTIMARWGGSETNHPAYTTNGATWSDGYEAVWHLSDQANLIDSTSNGWDGTGTGTLDVPGVIGGAQDVNGNEFIHSGPGIDLANRSFTVSVWARRESLGGNDYLIAHGAPTVDMGLHFGFRANNQFTLAFWGSDLSVPSLNDTANWHHWTGVYDHSSGEKILYRDGVEFGREPSPPYLGNPNTLLRIGERYNADRHNGEIDEVR
ncbi:MAG: DUF2341 domain-containing protein, partial [Verrucomicrobiota bacterium]